MYRAITELHCFRKLIINENTLKNPLEDNRLIPDFSSRNGKKIWTKHYYCTRRTSNSFILNLSCDSGGCSIEDVKGRAETESCCEGDEPPRGISELGSMWSSASDII